MRMARAWWITKKSAEDGDFDLRVTIDRAAAGAPAIDAQKRPEYCLLRSVDGGATWAKLPMEADGCSVLLPRGASADGLYTIGAEVTPVGTVMIFR
ncbi:MAG: hypothetical protein ACI4RA_05395 [Kiritimatiellia bacterium]